MKTNNKHTPGPWVLDNQWEKLTIKNIREMPMKNGTIEETVFEISQGFKPNSANLALIVAAPEMLDLLMELESTLVYIDSLSYQSYSDVSNELDKIRILIKKARGE